MKSLNRHARRHTLASIRREQRTAARALARKAAGLANLVKVSGLALKDRAWVTKFLVDTVSRGTLSV